MSLIPTHVALSFLKEVDYDTSHAQFPVDRRSIWINGGCTHSIAQDGDQPEGDPGEHYRAKQLLGSAVVLEGEKSVGTIDDIVLDADGNVDYLIVANKGKLVTVPWDAVKFNAEKKSTLLQITPERFQQIPTYAPNQYPAFATPKYRNEVYKYYGLTPGQQRRAIRRALAD